MLWVGGGGLFFFCGKKGGGGGGGTQYRYMSSGSTVLAIAPLGGYYMYRLCEH